MASKKDSRLTRAGVSGYNKPKRTPNHPTKSHVVVAKSGDKIKIRAARRQRRRQEPKDKVRESPAQVIQSASRQEHRKGQNVCSVLGIKDKVVRLCCVAGRVAIFSAAGRHGSFSRLAGCTDHNMRL